MIDAAKAADLGAGPWKVHQDTDDGFYYLWFTDYAAQDDTRRTDQGGPYPLMKTAAKRCRQLNASADSSPGIVCGLDLSGTVEDVLERYPDPTPPLVAADPGDAETFPTVAEIVQAQGDKPKRAKRAPKVKHGAAAEPSPTASFTGTREEWLNAFTAAARPAFKSAELDLPEKVRVSIGFTGARGGKRVLGACWHEEASTDGTREIFIVPTLDDSVLIAGVLTHELCHTLFGPDEKHGSRFRKAGAAMGLLGKATCMGGSPDLLADTWHLWADPILADLGPIPHAKLDPSKSGVKKQTTRLVKAECPTCGFIIRTTAKWVNSLSERGLDLQCPDPECVDEHEIPSLMRVAVPGEEEGE